MKRDRDPKQADVRIRRAAPEDNEALVALADACPMRAAISLCVHRDPDFFAVSRLQGDPWVVFVAEDPNEGIIGCFAGGVRRLWFGGSPRDLMIATDFKLHPRFRGRGLADRLMNAGWPLCEEMGIASFMAALAGNSPIERRVVNPPAGIPKPGLQGTVRVHTLLLPGLDLAWAHPDLTVRTASAEDADAMMALWARVAPERDGAPLLDVASFSRFVVEAPGLAWSDYLLAFEGEDLVGSLGIWDQRGLKQTLVLDFNLWTDLARRAHDAVAWALRSPRLPARGEALKALQALHLCVSLRRPEVLRALLIEGRARCVREGVPALEIGLDPRDPLTDALKAFPRIGVDVRCYLSPTPDTREVPPPSRNPLYFETALV